MIDIVCVIDKSGSMGPLVSDTIGSFNQFLKDQKALPGKAKMTLVLFDSQIHELHIRKKLQDVPELDNKTYHANGSTALLEATYKTIAKMKDRDKVIFMIITDGYENSSNPEYTRAVVKELVSEMENRGWEFHYLGVGIDDFAEANSIGIAKTSSFDHTQYGVRDLYASATMSATSYRKDNE